MWPRMAFRSCCMRGSSSGLSSRFASSATRRTSSRVTAPVCVIGYVLLSDESTPCLDRQSGGFGQLRGQCTADGGSSGTPTAVLHLDRTTPPAVADDAAAPGESAAARYGPCGGKAVFRPPCAQASRRGCRAEHRACLRGRVPPRRALRPLPCSGFRSLLTVPPGGAVRHVPPSRAPRGWRPQAKAAPTRRESRPTTSKGRLPESNRRLGKVARTRRPDSRQKAACAAGSEDRRSASSSGRIGGQAQLAGRRSGCIDPTPAKVR